MYAEGFEEPRGVISHHFYGIRNIRFIGSPRIAVVEHDHLIATRQLFDYVLKRSEIYRKPADEDKWLTLAVNLVVYVYPVGSTVGINSPSTILVAPAARAWVCKSICPECPAFASAQEGIGSRALNITYFHRAVGPNARATRRFPESASTKFK
ncbi:MAG: hypothetical protein LUP95_06175 [Euryarchaeota archaeon]|nr:hypothetical protein [Euryarchaeota archaeon]